MSSFPSLPAFRCAVLVVAPCGRIRFIGREAAGWVKEFFPRSTPPPQFLPAPLARWAQTGDASPHCWDRGGRRLVVSLLDRSRKGARCFLLRSARTGKARLSPRELEVLHWIAMGHSNAQIADHLHLAEGTVKTHATHIFDKLGVDNRTAAASYSSAFQLNGTPPI